MRGGRTKTLLDSEFPVDEMICVAWMQLATRQNRRGEAVAAATQHYDPCARRGPEDFNQLGFVCVRRLTQPEPPNWHWRPRREPPHHSDTTDGGRHWQGRGGRETARPWVGSRLQLTVEERKGSCDARLPLARAVSGGLFMRSTVCPTVLRRAICQPRARSDAVASGAGGGRWGRGGL